jgi:hypothetical protein
MALGLLVQLFGQVQRLHSLFSQTQKPWGLVLR